MILYTCIGIVCVLNQVRLYYLHAHTHTLSPTHTHTHTHNTHSLMKGDPDAGPDTMQPIARSRNKVCQHKYVVGSGAQTILGFQC